MRNIQRIIMKKKYELLDQVDWETLHLSDHEIKTFNEVEELETKLKELKEEFE